MIFYEKAVCDAVGARFNRLPPSGTTDFPTIQFEGRVIDKDGNGELSVGDIVKLRSTGGFRAEPGTEQFDHRITAEDLEAINQDRITK